MKINPLMIVATVFAASFSGRAITMAHAALTKDEKKTPVAEMTATTKPVDLMPNGSSSSPAAQKPAAAPDAAANAKKVASAAGSGANQTARQASPSMEQLVRETDISGSAANKARQYGELISAIKDRAQAIDDRSLEVEDRIRVLEILEQRIEKNLAELRKSNSELSELVSFANEASQQDIDLLAKMYEQMKPAKAGEIFDKMNPTFAAGFLTEMNAEAAALILTNMSTEQAYKTSMIIASRNAAVHQQ